MLKVSYQTGSSLTVLRGKGPPTPSHPPCTNFCCVNDIMAHWIHVLANAEASSTWLFPTTVGKSPVVFNIPVRLWEGDSWRDQAGGAGGGSW